MMQVNIWFTNSRSRDSFVQIHCIWTRMSLSFELDLWRQRSIYNVITIFAFVYIKLKQDSTKISFNTLTWFDIQFHNDLINFLKRAIELDIMELNYSAFIAAFLYALSSRSSDSQCCGHLNSPQRQATHMFLSILWFAHDECVHVYIHYDCIWSFFVRLFVDTCLLHDFANAEHARPLLASPSAHFLCYNVRNTYVGHLNKLKSLLTNFIIYSTFYNESFLWKTIRDSSNPLMNVCELIAVS